MIIYIHADIPILLITVKNINIDAKQEIENPHRGPILGPMKTF